MTWFQETLYNLKNNTAIKIWIGNFTNNPKQALLNELSPSSWLNPDHKLHWSNMKPEAIGWLKHIGIGAIAYVVLSALGLNWWQSLIAIAVGTFVVEIIQFFVTRALFVNPINSILDISFYVLGGVLVIGLLS